MVNRDLSDVAVAANPEELQLQNGSTHSGARPDLPKSSILDTVGNTPIIELRKIFADGRFKLFGKIEAMNPGGSIKDRAGLHMLREALASGIISHNTTIIESSSGNMAIALAQACAYWGFKLICVVDVRTTKQNIKILRAYGAKISLVSEPLPSTNSLLEARKLRVHELLASVPDSYCPDQYVNPNNFDAHYLGTMPEILSALKSHVDYVFLATGTCGTLRGCAEYIHDNGFSTKVIAVDAIGSVIFGGKPQPRLLPGHGASETSQIHREGLADDVVLISDYDCVTGCRNLVRQEAVLAGASSGGVIAAINKYRGQIKQDAICVAILADRGERYMDTVYSDDWVLQNFDELPDTAEYSKPVDDAGCA